jgi:serine/threonine protein kinase
MRIFHDTDLTFQIATGSVPRSSVPSMRLLFSIIAEPAPELQGSFSDELKDFVSQCLQKDPQSRSSAIDLLIHPFVANAKVTDEIYQWIEQITFSGGPSLTESHPFADQVPTDHAPVETVQDITPKSECIQKKTYANTWGQLASMTSTMPCASDLYVLLQHRASQHDGQHEDMIVAPLGKFMMERNRKK